jgi:sec-independent protein translocase protein TatC
VAFIAKRSRTPAGDSGAQMTVIEHLGELRRRMIICLIAVAACAVVAFVAYDPILKFLQDPYCDVVGPGESCQFLATSVLDPFAIRLQIATYGGLILAAPIVFWQLWRFIAPGLTSKERRYAVPFIASSVVLFALGGFIAYLTFPKALDFLVHIGGTSIDVHPTPTKYLQLILLMILAFGLSFEFPVFLVFLQLVGIVSSTQLRQWRRWAIVGVVTFAAVITPSQDPYSLLAMAVPMWLFYEAAILVGRALKR